MKKNIGTLESHMRSIAGAIIVLFALFLVDHHVTRILLAVLAAILAGTAFIRICPINALLKRDTSEYAPTEESPEEEFIEDTPTETETIEEAQEEEVSEEAPTETPEETEKQ